MQKLIRIGTRESKLAIWQANFVQQHLSKEGYNSELVFIKSEGDNDLVTPLYEIGVEGIFTKALDAALLNNRIDLAVHSLKDVPVQPAKGIFQAAILKRGNYRDLLVYRSDNFFLKDFNGQAVIATSSLRRKAQWLHRYPNHNFENLRGNINTRLKKLEESNWNGAIFAAAGLERIDLRPENSIELEWMLPAPAQGAILVVCREKDNEMKKICAGFNDPDTAFCTKIERDFLKTLLGGCATPISALAVLHNEQLHFHGNVLSPDGKEKLEIESTCCIKENGKSFGTYAAKELLAKGADKIVNAVKNA